LHHKGEEPDILPSEKLHYPPRLYKHPPSESFEHLQSPLPRREPTPTSPTSTLNSGENSRNPGYSSASYATSGSKNYNRTDQDGSCYTESTSRPKALTAGLTDMMMSVNPRHHMEPEPLLRIIWDRYQSYRRVRYMWRKVTSPAHSSISEYSAKLLCGEPVRFGRARTRGA